MDDRTFDQQTAQDWIQAVEKNAKSFRDEFVFPKLNQMIQQTRPKKILDIGCGQGICSDKIDLSSCKYVGVEPSPFLLNRAKQLYPMNGREFLLGNAYSLPFADSSFDASFSVMVWHLLGDIQKAASELSRVLSTNGSFIIITANPKAYSSWKAFYPDAKIDGKKLEGTMQMGDTPSYDVLYLHTLSELENSMQLAGLKIDITETFLSTKSLPNENLLISFKGKKSVS